MLKNNFSGSVMKNCLLLLAVFFSCKMAKANVRLPSVISSNMVLQQKTVATIWGWAEPGEKVFITTSWNNRIDSVKTNGWGKWALSVTTGEAGGPYTITIKGWNTIVLNNVLLGEVWICSGQSNMEMNYYWGLPQMNADIPSSQNANIRFFHIPRKSAETPQENSEGNWTICDSNTVKAFSAVAYYFGKRLNKELSVPIGLIHASWGGTPAEAWTPAQLVNENETLKVAAKKLNPSEWWPVQPGLTFNAMIAPLKHFNIAGVIWYQGESNVGTADSYKTLFTTMIQSWREEWKKDLPFFFVQLAPYAYGTPLEGARLREAQLETLDLHNTGMVVTTDLADDTLDIHPKYKKEVGLRLAGLALQKTYGYPVRGVGPVPSGVSFDKGKAVVKIINAGQGLVQKASKTALFFVAGADGRFYPAQVKISGSTITAWSKEVKQPIAVRYAFSNTAVGNIFNKEGLPLTPFRTDRW
jgi:sialate O-acetylesterase